MPLLKISLPDGTHLDHELTHELVTVGRATDNTIVIDDPSVSGHHAQIAPGGEGYIFKDFGSTNGSFINAEECTPEGEYQLDPGDAVVFGKVAAVFDPEHATKGEAQELPEDKHTAAVAKSSVKPSNFMNASPFQKRSDKKDPAGVAIMGFAVLALVVVLVVTAMVFSMSADS